MHYSFRVSCMLQPTRYWKGSVVTGFIKRYRRQSALKALKEWGPLFTLDVDEVLPTLGTGRI